MSDIIGFYNQGPTRSGPDKNRIDPEPKISNYPIGSSTLQPEIPRPEKIRPEPEPKTRMSMPKTPECPCLEHALTTRATRIFALHLINININNYVNPAKPHANMQGYKHTYLLHLYLTHHTTQR